MCPTELEGSLFSSLNGRRQGSDLVSQPWTLGTALNDFNGLQSNFSENYSKVSVLRLPFNGLQLNCAESIGFKTL